jgi:hypothetical protein
VDSGSRTIADSDLPDVDILGVQSLMEAIARDDSIHDGDGYPPTMTAIVIARFAQMAVEQNHKILGRGKPTEFRKRARILVETALLGSGYTGGSWTAAHCFFEIGELSENTFRQWCETTKSLEWKHIRDTARQCALILSDVKSLKERRGKGAGRRVGDLSVDDVEALQLSSMVQEAIVAANSNALRCGSSPDSISVQDVRAQFRSVVDHRLRSGQLRNLGATHKDAVDAYQKRLNRFHETTMSQIKPGPISIDWKFRHLMDASTDEL